MKVKRIKKVFSGNNQVLHLWANKSQTDARSKNCFFRGDSVWSYGTHYELGRFVTYKGIEVAVINDSGYSKTTEKHICHAYMAVSHLIRVKSSTFNVFEGLLQEQEQLIDDIMAFFNKRKTYWDSFPEYIESQIIEFNRKCNLLDHHDLTLDLKSELFSTIFNEQLLVIKQKMSFEKSPEMIKKKIENEQKKTEKIILEWRQGYTRTIKTFYPLLRVKGDSVQSSQGASVPLNQALQLLRLIEARQVKEGHKIGSFSFSGINDGLIKIGCHSIQLTEAQNVLNDYLNNQGSINE